MDRECQCFFCQGFPDNFTTVEVHQAAQELALTQRNVADKAAHERSLAAQESDDEPTVG